MLPRRLSHRLAVCPPGCSKPQGQVQRRKKVKDPWRRIPTLFQMVFAIGFFYPLPFFDGVNALRISDVLNDLVAEMEELQ